MVRAMLGTLVEFGLGRGEGTTIEEILCALDRRQAGKTAPACGLSLVRVFYNDVPGNFKMSQEAQNGYCIAFYPPVT